ncbi:MAG TPA: hypothetical protein PKH16_00130 [Aequorivita sp.]|nr:hypothetical protein [Aequorivita sp.]
MDPFDRNTNLLIIEQVRNLPNESLTEFIYKVICPLNAKNSNFLKALYKDILYVLDGFEKEDEGDIIFDENGELVIEDNDFKISGYQTSLQALCNWLHLEQIKGFEFQSDKVNLMDSFERANKKLAQKENYTPQYKFSLNKIKSDLIKERNENYDFPDNE